MCAYYDNMMFQLCTQGKLTAAFDASASLSYNITKYYLSIKISTDYEITNLILFRLYTCDNTMLPT